MSTFVYPKALAALMSADIDLPADTVKLVLVSGAYTASTSHEFLSDVGAGHRVATSPALTTKAVTSGVFTADDPTFSAVAAGPAVRGWIAYVDTGVEATSRLLCYVDHRADSVPLEIITNGDDITLTLPAGKVFRI